MGGEWNTGATLVAETWPTSSASPGDCHCAERVGVGGWLAAALVSWDRARQAAPENWRFVLFCWRAAGAGYAVDQKRACLNLRCGSSREDQTTMKAAFLGNLHACISQARTIFLLLLNIFGLFAWWGIVQLDAAVPDLAGRKRRARP